ncbi:MAG: hypothetical protein AB7P48_06955, partial [Methylocystis sp.]
QNHPTDPADESAKEDKKCDDPSLGGMLRYLSQMKCHKSPRSEWLTASNPNAQRRESEQRSQSQARRRRERGGAFIKNDL